MLYGIYGVHTIDNCPLVNADSRKAIIRFNELKSKVEEEFGIRFIGMFHSALEHEFLWVVEANNAHSIQDMLIKNDLHRFNSAKIVPLGTFDDLVKKCLMLEKT